VHEIPQEVGDFMVLLSSGYGRRRALLLNLVCSCASIAGGLLGYFLLQDAMRAVPYILALAAASFIYIAIADLMPALHRDRGLSAAPIQIASIVAGIGSIAAAHGGH
jgi:zinc and cadmium transporter